jgi:hypothetical protein
VVDQSGQAVVGMTVRLSYQNYSAEASGHELDALSDDRGHASFPAQTIRAPVARRLLSILSSAAAGVHASFGPHAYVFAFGQGLEGQDVDPTADVLVDWTGAPTRMKSRIVVKPLATTR